MRVLFVVSVMGAGNGGHLYSLNHISTALGEYIEYGIISIGPGKTDVVSNYKNHKGHVYLNGLNFVSFRRKIVALTREFKPDIFHCFDDKAYNMIKLCKLEGIKAYALNKCGGPNPHAYPVAENIVVFSKENLKWFGEHSRYNNTPFYFIPNRVHKVNVAAGPGFPVKQAGTFSFVRIARIGNNYKKSIIDSIKLIKELSAENKVCLFIIGVIEEEAAYKEIKVFSAGLPVVFLTEKQFTNGASKMLYLADAVIATGRGLMEAASLGLPLLTPVKGKTLPVLVDEQNFESFFLTNFSERNEVDTTEEEDLGNIRRVIKKERYYDELADFSLKMFGDNFDLSVGVIKYLDMYKAILVKGISYPFYKEIVLKFKTLYTYYKSSKLITEHQGEVK